MSHLNALLLLVLVASALGTVAAEHKARQLFTKWQEEQQTAAQLQVEWRQLQLDLSTWSMHSRIEKIATQQLKMRIPQSTQIHILPPAKAQP